MLGMSNTARIHAFEKSFDPFLVEGVQLLGGAPTIAKVLRRIAHPFGGTGGVAAMPLHNEPQQLWTWIVPPGVLSCSAADDG